MYYLLLLLLFIVSYYVFVKLLSSLVKGCLMAVLILILFVGVTLFLKSRREPVNIFNLYKIDNFEVIRIR